MTHVRTVVAGTCEAHLSVQVGSVQINESPVFVHDAAHVTDLFLEDAVRRGVCDHDRSEVVGVLSRLRFEVRDIDRASVRALHDDDLHTGHDRARGVRAVGRRGDQADVSVALASILVVRPHRQQARVLALCARVGLQRRRDKTADLSEPLFEFSEERGVTSRLIQGGEWMEAGHLRPRHTRNLAGRVQFHRARAERDHAHFQREVTRLQPVQVPKHLGLGMVPVEHLVLEIRRGSTSPDRQLRRRPPLRELSGGEVRSHATVEDLEEVVHVIGRRDLVEGDTQRPSKVPQVDARFDRARERVAGVQSRRT